MSSIDKTTELILQACGLERQNWTFGYGDRIYKDPNNTYITDAKTGIAYFHYRQNEPLSTLSQRYML